MSLVTINVDRKKLPEHTDDQFEAWIRFCIGDRGGISLQNPLHEYDLEATLWGIERE